MSFFNFFKKIKREEIPSTQKVIYDLQRATEQTFNEYKKTNDKLEEIQSLYEMKSRDLKLFKAISEISLKIMSVKDFAKVMKECLMIITKATDYDYCGIFMNNEKRTFANVLFEYFHNNAAQYDDFTSYIDFENKRTSWQKKLANCEHICGGADQLGEDDLVDYGVQNVCAIPIFVGSNWWGCLFLTSFEKIEMSENEIEAFRIITNIFGEAIKKNDLLRESALIQSRFQDFSTYLLKNNDTVAFWMKDYQDRYLFMNEELLKLIFKDKDRNDCLGRTDPDIVANKAPYHLDFRNIYEPKDLPSLNLVDIDYERICNITDQLTRHFGHPCKYFEMVGGYVFEVWKLPLFRNNAENDQYCCAGTIGALKDVTNYKDTKYKCVKKLEEKGLAFRIDNTDNYYLVDVDDDSAFL